MTFPFDFHILFGNSIENTTMISLSFPFTFSFYFYLSFDLFSSLCTLSLFFFLFSAFLSSISHYSSICTLYIYLPLFYFWRSSSWKDCFASIFCIISYMYINTYFHSAEFHSKLHIVNIAQVAVFDWNYVFMYIHGFWVHGYDWAKTIKPNHSKWTQWGIPIENGYD